MDFSSLLTVQDLGRYFGKPGKGGTASSPDSGGPGRWLWRGVNFEVKAGDWWGIVAPSGTGKTLLLRNLVLLDPLQQGQIGYQGKSLSTWSLPLYRSQVIYLPQRAIAFSGTVQDNLEQVFRLQIYRERCFQREPILDWLAQLGRGPEFLDLSGSQLSGGEMQLLALLRALQVNPHLLLLDEPTASLDADTTLAVENLLKHWLQQPDRACLMTSHNQQQIQRLTSHQLALGDFAG